MICAGICDFVFAWNLVLYFHHINRLAKDSSLLLNCLCTDSIVNHGIHIAIRFVTYSCFV